MVVENTTNKDHDEKNWMPFTYQSQLYVLYSIEPYKILKVDLSTGNSRVFTHQIIPNRFELMRYVFENLGTKNYISLDTEKRGLFHNITGKEITFDLRGGTALVKVPGRDYYLGVAHLHYHGIRSDGSSLFSQKITSTIHLKWTASRLLTYFK